MQPDRRDAALLWDMLQYAREAAFFVQGRTWDDYRRDRMLRAAVERVVGIVGEAASKISKDYRGGHPEVPWGTIAGQRHLLVHEYGRIDDAKIWEVATTHVPSLIGQLERLIPPLPSDPLPEPPPDEG